MPVQKRIAQVSLAKQSAKGSAASAGTYQIGVSAGQVVNADVSEDVLPSTWSNRVAEGFDRTGVLPGAAFDFIAMPKTIGMLLYAACGTIADAGGGAPYTHTITPGTALPYLTLFSTFGAEFYKIADCVADELELSWDSVGALKAKVKIAGCTLTFPGSAYTAGTDERPSGGVLKGCGGTFQIDGADATIKSGSIKITNKVAPVYGSSAVQPADVFPAQHSMDVSLVVVPSDMTLWRKALTGATGGTTPQCVVQYGTAEQKWILDANTDLDLLVSRMKFAVPFPDADPGGGPAEVTLEGMISNPTSGSAYTFTLRNNVASY